MNKNFILMKIFHHCPKNIRDELQIMCVLFTEDVGGVLTLGI